MDKRRLFFGLAVTLVLSTTVFALCVRRIGSKRPSFDISKQPHGRLLCFVLTHSKQHVGKAWHVRNTWGKKCDTLLFMSDKKDPALNSIDLSKNVKNGREWLWKKTMESLKYIYKHHFHEADWILKADDDTYVAMENLQNFLSQYSWNHNHYFGGIFQYWPGGWHLTYNTGGAGYILSKACLKKFINEGIPMYMNSSKAEKMEDNQGEDIELAMVLKSLGIQPEDTRDETGARRFFQSSPDVVTSPDTRFTDFKWRDFWLLRSGVSKKFISFHYITPRLMYFLDWIVHSGKQ